VDTKNQTKPGSDRNAKRNSSKAVLAAALALSLLWVTVAEGAVTLAADGKAEAVIVTPAKNSPTAREDAEILRDHFFQISGAKFNVLRESELKDVTAANDRLEAGTTTQQFILVGEGELAGKLGITSKGLGPGGILILIALES